MTRIDSRKRGHQKVRSANKQSTIAMLHWRVVHDEELARDARDARVERDVGVIRQVWVDGRD